MRAELGWIDFSNEHRQSVLRIIDSMGESGTLDQLGVGAVRDSIANWLFPGISTIQTRAKYFILVPQMFQKYLRQNLNKSKQSDLIAYCKEEEKRLINALVKNNVESSNSETGIIGVTKAGTNKELNINPSAIYWTGLRVHQIIQTHLSINDYLRSNNLANGLLNEFNDDEQSDDFNPVESNFGFKLNGLKEYDLDNVVMALSKEEGEFLKEKFTANSDGLLKQQGNLLALILKNEVLQTILLSNETSNFRTFAQLALQTNLLPEDTRKVLAFAVDFDFLMHGANIVYNINVQKLHGIRPEFMDDLYGLLNVWKETIKENIELFINLDLAVALTKYAPSTKTRSKHFIIEWRRLVISDINNQKAMDELIYRQEVELKSNPKQMPSHSGEYDGWIGIFSMEFRFNQVKKIIKDIRDASR